MRASEIAELTGTTVRTIRYYHSLGLLPVPAERGGWRDYDLAHVARLSRIRWLVSAGLPLSAVARVLDGQERDGDASPDEGQGSNDCTGPDGGAGSEGGAGFNGGAPHARPSAVVEDLSAALEAVEEHLTEVTAQRDMLRTLLARARQGHAVSPMPEAMVDFFDRLQAAAPDERTRAVVQRDRDVMDLACYRGQIPPEAEFLFGGPDEQHDAEVLLAYSRAGGAASEMSQEQIEAHAARNVRQTEARLGPQRAAELARSVDEEVVRSFFRLSEAVEPFDARLTRAMERHLLEAIARWRRA